jgi:FkbM family methyltransferase
MLFRIVRLFAWMSVAAANKRSSKMAHFNESSPTTLSFLHSLAANPSALVLDVGSNNGMWADQIMHAADAWQRRTSSHAAIDLVMFEVQPRFFRALDHIATKWNGSLVAKAAWTSDTNMTLHVSGMKVASSLVESMARRFKREGTLAVQAIDFADWLERRVRPLVGRPKSVFLKLDIESAEYYVLPHLLTHGALCLVDHLLVEWHLNAMPSSRRLAGVGLRLTLEDTLMHGCPRNLRPRVVEHDVPYETNGGITVPGLAKEATSHEMSAWGKRHRLSWLSAQRKTMGRSESLPVR